MARTKSTKLVRARIDEDLYGNVHALAYLRGLERGERPNDSTVLREALIAYFRSPVIGSLVSEAKKLMERDGVK